ncbi:MAG TPA: hypothetical protein VFR85_13455 [Anaeromyxobacteraceae bacterium]|nr:hypothetical protein [Anaeromyxobacteraceae bacterium]
MTARTGAALSLAAAAALFASCASIEAERARQEALVPRLDALSYSRPLDEVWDQGRRLLAEKGYPLDGKDAEAVGKKPNPLEFILSRAKDTRPDPDGGQFLETGWGPRTLRYRFRAWTENSNTRVAFWAIGENPAEPGRDASPPTRGVDMELELARRLDPEAAAAIEAAVTPQSSSPKPSTQ